MTTDAGATIERSKTLVLLARQGDQFPFESTLQDVGRPGNVGGGREVVHHLLIRGQVHAATMELSEVRAEFPTMPYGTCALTTAVVGRLNGLRIGPGYRRAVLDIMGGTRGCTHFLSASLELSQLHTLLTYTRMREAMPSIPRSDPRWIAGGMDMEPGLENACLSLAEDSPVILAGKQLRP